VPDGVAAVSVWRIWMIARAMSSRSAVTRASLLASCCAIDR